MEAIVFGEPEFTKDGRKLHPVIAAFPLELGEVSIEHNDGRNSRGVFKPYKPPTSTKGLSAKENAKFSATGPKR